MYFKLLVVVGFFLIITSIVMAKSKKIPRLKKGTYAPDFTLMDENNTPCTLSTFKGKKVVLYFYPKDDTSGCTQEACGLRDAFGLYTNNNILILGVNYDSPESHTKFKAKHNLPFTLLSDNQRTVAQLYGADQNFLGKLVPQRKTILIDEQGKIVAILEDVDVRTHAQDILNAFGIQK